MAAISVSIDITLTCFYAVSVLRISVFTHSWNSTDLLFVCAQFIQAQVLVKAQAIGWYFTSAVHTLTALLRLK